MVIVIFEQHNRSIYIHVSLPLPDPLHVIDMHTNIELFVRREVKFKVLHVLGCFVDDEPSCKLSRAEPERVAGLTVQLKLCMDSDSNKHINKQSNTSNNMQCLEFFCYEN